MIDDTHKFILILLPKTGTTSLTEIDFIRKNIDPKKHDVHRHYDTIHDSQMDYYKVCTCRNPYSKCISLWSYWSMRFKVIGKDTFDFQNFMLNFDEIVQRVIQTFGEYEEVHFKSCYESIKFSTNGKLSFNDIDNWLKFESLQEDFDTICDRIKIPRQQLPHKNKMNHKHYTEYYDDVTKKIVTERFAEDIKYLNYKYGE